MKETYGILGSGSAPRKVIEASLQDLGASTISYVVPWYGKVTPGLEVVYDWLLDNKATFKLVSKETGKTPPKVLASSATSVEYVDDIDLYILNHLKGLEIPGLSLVLWNNDDEHESITISSMSIDMRLPTLELTNGLTPIMIDAGVEEVRDEDLPDIGEASYSKETLEVMPAALVKRMAKDKGITVRTKEEGIEVLTRGEAKEPEEIGSVVFIMRNGDELGFTLSQEMFQKIMTMVVESQKH